MTTQTLILTDAWSGSEKDTTHEGNTEILGEISSSHGGEYEDDCLLVCCAV
jgi:hypothetical protein